MIVHRGKFPLCPQSQNEAHVLWLGSESEQRTHKYMAHRYVYKIIVIYLKFYKRFSNKYICGLISNVIMIAEIPRLTLNYVRLPVNLILTVGVTANLFHTHLTSCLGNTFQAQKSPKSLR